MKINKYSLLSFTVLTTVACFYSCRDSKVKYIGTGSLDIYWEIESSLKNDMEPDSILWDELFNTPGYKTLTERELPKEWMQHYISLGIKPSESEEREIWKEKNYYDYRFVRHFAEVKDNTELLQNFSREINNRELIDRSLKLMLNYWTSSLGYADSIPVEFIFFDRDARGYEPILIDLLYAYETSRKGELELLLAHEMHHFCRNRYLSFKRPSDTLPEYYIIWIMNQVHAEGIADLIDKPTRFDNPLNADKAKRYYSYLADTPGHIKKMDSLLVNYSLAGEEKKQIARQISQTAPNSGHPMGYFMASVILNESGKETLLSQIGNPFNFFRLYNDAASKYSDKYPRFSEKSIEVINKLESEYSIPAD